MWRYPLSPELKAPRLDLRGLKLDGATVKLLAIMSGFDAKSFHAPQGTRLSRITIPGWEGAQLACCIVEPLEASRDAPCVLYFHGGGFVFPLQKMMLRIASTFARETGARVILPEYRLTLRHPFPAPAEDCFASLLWVVGHASELGIDPSRVALYGESSGGCLAAAVALMARDRKGPSLRFQMLVYPVTDSAQSGESLRTYADGLWPTSANSQMWSLYLRNGDFGIPDYASPLAAEDLSGLPPAYVELAERDCLYSEGAAYAARLAQAGCAVETSVVPGTYHGWDQQFKSPLTQRALAHRCELLKRAFERRGEKFS